MKKLSVFNYIERATQDLESERENYSRAAGKIALYLEKAFEDADEVVGVTYRVKTAPSLREKIIRNNLYKQFSADELVSSCSDIIGLRIECRFLEDEAKVYERLKTIFAVDRGEDGLFSPESKRNLYLKMGTPQPERQKNGLEIYRIDGNVLLGGDSFRYELQIKSLVNSFWSEIEHKIIYKNKRFMMIDGFVGELMDNINENLRGIDHQLNMLFKRCLDSSHSSQQNALETMLTTLINELYSFVVEKRAGISVSIKPYSESLVRYILGYSSFKATQSELFGNTPAGSTISNVMDWLKTIDYAKIPIGEEITLPEMRYKTELQRVIGQRFLRDINADFYCNTFFHILFSLEVGNDAQDFMSYVRYYEYRIGQNATPERVEALRQAMDATDAGKLLLEKQIVHLQNMGSEALQIACKNNELSE